MHENFQMSAMGELNFFLGLQVLQKEDGIFLSQDKYVGNILKKFRYSDVRSSNTPMDKENPWGPDIMFAVCACARHQVTPKECHLHAVKWIFRYLKGHPKLRLWYPKESPFDLLAYLDSDYGGATQDRKSTTRGCQFFGRRLISWKCKKQTIVATSTTEAEYVAAAMVNMCINFLHGSDSDQRTHEFIHVYLASASVYVWIGYALTFKPTVYISHIRQFWSTARIETTKEGTKILATVDGILRTVTESSLRRNLKLQDEEGIRFNEFSSNIATTLVCLATNMTYNFSKMIFNGLVKNVNNKVSKFLMYPSPSFSGRIVPLFDTMLVPHGEGSGTPTEPHHTPSPEAHPTSHTTHSSPTLTPVTTASIPTIRTGQTLLRPPPCPMIQYQGLQRQHSVLISKFEAHELEINRLKARVKLLEDREGVAAERSEDDAPIKGRNLDKREAAAERVSDDTEEMATLLTSMETATVLASGVAEVPTGSGSIPTAGSPTDEVPTGSNVIPTASLIFATATVVTPYTRRKGKEVMVEAETPKKKKVQEQIDAQVVRELEEQMAREDQRMSKQVARDAEVAKIHAEEELQMMINSLDRSNETVLKYLQKLNKESHGLRSKRGTTTWQSSKKSAKKLKTSEEVPEEVKSPDEVLEEKEKEMMQLVPIEEVYVEALKVKHPIIDWKVHTEGKRSYWKITRLGGSSASYQFFVDMLKHLDREDLNKLWRIKLYDSCGVHYVTTKDKEIFMLVEKDYPLRNGLPIVMISYKLQVENDSRMANDLILNTYKNASTPRQQVIEFPLAEEVPTASEESSHCQKKRDATAKRIALLGKCPMITPRFLERQLLYNYCTGLLVLQKESLGHCK
nr:hypothetical protein [Tanacetum cinerariifolium]